MAEKDIKKPTRLSDSATYKIGGRDYKSHDVSRLQPVTKEVKTVSGMENAPRQVKKEVENLSGSVQTTAGTFKSSEAVHTQTETYKPSVNTQASVKSSEPIVSSSQPITQFVKTGSEISRASEQKVVTQTEAYRATNAYSTERTEVRSGISAQPRTVEAVKTSSPSSPQRASEPFVSVPTSSQKPVSQSLKTGSEISRVAEQKVMTQTEAFHSTNAFSTEKREIRSGVSSQPRTVDAVKTIQAVGGKAQPNATPFSTPNVANVRMVAPMTIPLSQNKIAEMQQNYLRMGATGNVTTQSVASGLNTARVMNLTGGAKQAFATQRILGANGFDFKNQTTGQYIASLGKMASYTISNEQTKALQRFGTGSKGDLLSGGKMLLGKAESSLIGSDDLGTSSTGAVIGAGITGYSAFRLSQQATEIGVEGIKKTGNGIYQVATTAGLTAITVGKTAQTVINQQAIVLSRDTISILKQQAVLTGLNNTQIARGIVNRVNTIKTAYADTVSNVKKVGSAINSTARGIHHAVDTSVKIVHGLANGTLTVNATAQALNAFRKRAFLGIQTGMKNGVRTAVGYSVRGVAKAGSATLFNGLPTAGRFLKGGLLAGAGALSGSDDYALRGLGNAINMADAGIKTAKVGVTAGAKATGYTVKTGIKAGKGAYAGAKFIKNNGLKTAWITGRRKITQKVVQASKSAVTAFINFIRHLGMRAILPLLLICVIIVMAVGGVSAPFAVVGGIFGGEFDTTEGGNYEIREYILDPTNGVPAIAERYKQDLLGQMEQAKNTSEIVRFYYNGEATPIDPTYEGINGVFPSTEELANMVHPVFNALLLMNYDLMPSEAEASELLNTLLNGLFRIETINTLEQCGQDLRTGEGEVTVHDCGEVHALSDCPKPITGTHSSHFCDDCCYEYCDGHTETDAEGNETTDYCDGCKHGCSGYSYCGKHRVTSFYLTLDGAYALEKKYFTDPINELSNISNRTEEQEEQLQKLKDFYEIYLELMLQIGAEYGGGLTMSDLSGVEFVNGTRTPNQAVIDLALLQVGQQGGQPYWSYYGFSSRVEWCACFVHWCMNKTPSAVGKYPNTANNAYCPTVSQWFKDNGRWGDRGYTNLVAGDTIFFDWEGDGTTDHIGLVIGRDSEYVYTVEGNSGDAVKVKQYRIGSSVIYGYGLMNF